MRNADGRGQEPVLPTSSVDAARPYRRSLSFNLADGRSGETTAAAECSRSIHE